MPHPFFLVDDPLFLAHRAESAHPERPERLLAARKVVRSSRVSPLACPLGPRDVSDAEVLRVHSEEYLVRLTQANGQRGSFDADTYFGPSSVAAARRAAGGVVELTESLLDCPEDASHVPPRGLALVRPPGHHARPDTPMGFCLINNVAVAVAHARTRVERVLVLDWDVHHGNGTQEIFYDDPHVLFVSLHQFPFYPGTGAAEETGCGEGRGYTVNIPLSAGATDAVYEAAVARIVAPLAARFLPDLVLVSSGFDAHARDPLAQMSLSGYAYANMLGHLLEALDSALPLGLVLEGGYDLPGIEEALSATLTRALDLDVEPTSRSAISISPRHASELDRVKALHQDQWRL